MRILAFETSIGECTVALRDSRKVFISTSPRKMSQSEELVPRINALLEQASLSYKDLDIVACSIGPGSFTGIRVGVATARGIKKAIPTIKIVGVSTLQLISLYNQHYRYKNLLVALQSYGTKFYTQTFDFSTQSQSEITMMDQEGLLQYTQDKIVVSTEDAVHYINAYNVLNASMEKYHQHHDEIVSPLYVQQPNIHIKKNI